MAKSPYYVTRETLGKKAREWASKIKPYNQHRMQLNTRKTALLVIDMQNFFLYPKGGGFTEGGPAIIPNVARLIEGFRQVKAPVTYTAHVHHRGGRDVGILGWWWSEACLEGTPDALIHENLRPRGDDKIIYKHRYSAFFGTDLDIILRGQGIQDLVVTGVMTNLCCESTARDAYFRDYRVFFLLDATASVNEDLHLAALKNLAYGFAYVTTTGEILRMTGHR
jgi:nicotinamidase-related amidase